MGLNLGLGGPSWGTERFGGFPEVVVEGFETWCEVGTGAGGILFTEKLRE